ncbi:MAG: ABC transporter permease subunit [Hyphomicrobium sp.]|nr:ABC transporter permease subunit [Hyphomicrobium sp.]
MAPGSTPISSTRRRANASAAWMAGFERLGWVVASLLAFVALWQVIAMIANDVRRFPTPAAVLETVMQLAASGALWSNIGVTLVRVALAFFSAMIIGSVIGILLGKYPRVDRFFDPWLVLFLNLPAIVTITLCFIWGGLTQTAAVTAVALNKIPSAAVTLREGTRALSRDLNEMALIYKFGWWKTLRHVTIPQLAPYFAGAARTGLALIWKIVLVVEAFGGNGRGVGYQIFIAFQEFDVSTILAYALAFILIVQIIEFTVLQPLLARVNRWRR